MVNPVRVLLLENAKTQGLPKVDGIPEITWQDSALACAGSYKRCYLAARLIHGDISASTISALQEYLWWEVARMVQRHRWNVPTGSEIYRLLCDLAIVETSSVIKTDEVRLIVLDELTKLRKPKNPYIMTPTLWRRWKQRYAAIMEELQFWADVHFAHMGRKLN